MQTSFKINLSAKEKIKHLIIWVIMTVFFCIVDPPPEIGFILSALAVFITMFGYIFVYYTHYLFIFPNFFYKSIRKMIFYSVVVFIIFELLNHFNIYYLMTMGGSKSIFSIANFYDLAIVLILNFFIVFVVAVANFKNKISLEKIKIQNQNDKILLTKELGFYKNQFNSHITFNFLNYCYSYLHISSKEAARAIELFSELLRYALNNKHDEAVKIESEIQHVKDFISLHKQINKKIQVQFITHGKFDGVFILPRLLITLVENAFKHGDSCSILKPINIQLVCRSNEIDFFVENAKDEENISFNSTGIGYLNLRKQLELFYPGKHQFKIEDDKERYFCRLLLTI